MGEKRTCAFKDCDKPIRARGLCSGHYRQWKKGADLTPLRAVATKGKWTGKTCGIQRCSRPVLNRGLCTTHLRHEREGRGFKEIRPIKPGEWGPWHVAKRGYVSRVRRANGRLEHEYEHRFVMEQMLGRPLLKGESVHHRDGNRSNNSRDNLELWSTVQPAGQRVEDKVTWAQEILRLYGSAEIKKPTA